MNKQLLQRRAIGARSRPSAEYRSVAYRGLAVVARALGGNLRRCRFVGFGCAGITEPREGFTIEIRDKVSTDISHFTPACDGHPWRR
jgi:hypothetical protein